nr:DEAD/DEAH box helicase family protein [Pseudoclavibacter sp. 13-3]
MRTYQRDILQRIEFAGHESLHIVAPPGSGKTLVGMLLAMRDGRRAVVLAPTVTIRQQWARTASGLAASTPQKAASLDPAASAPPDRLSAFAPRSETAVSEDPQHLGDLTALTYQMVSTVADSKPFDDVAAELWVNELVEGGRTEHDARAWLSALEQSNPQAWRAGVRRRAARARKSEIADDPATIERALHPNAVALIDRLVAHGVRTIILDECHHLLDHWALVIRCLVARIRATGDTPLLIGLTATLPSSEDPHYANYAQLLGEVDYEVPTPAVIREGNLAPSRDIVWFTEPTADEQRFLRRHDDELQQLITDTLGAADGHDWLISVLQPPASESSAAMSPDSEDAPGASLAASRPSALDSQAARDAALARAFDTDFDLAHAAAVMLADLDPRHPLVGRLPAGSTAAPTAEDRFTVLARYALQRLLIDPARVGEWRRMRRVLADLGWRLTDRGLRRGRDTVEQVLAMSAAKDQAAVDILHEELRHDGELVRAVVVTDFATHGNSRSQRHAAEISGGARLRGAAAGPTAASAVSAQSGALRAFDTIAADPAIAELHPVLVTGQHLRVRADQAERLATALSQLCGATCTVRGGGESVGTTSATPQTGMADASVVDIVTDASAATIIAGLNRLVTEGRVRVLVGTRGLLGEGWDCPAMNTLIDLTATATSAATQQLRGRTLRLDPTWPGKVAHNWTVTCLLPARSKLDGSSELSRLRRKHEHLWGVDLESEREIVTGLAPALTSEQIARLRARLGQGGETGGTASISVSREPAAKLTARSLAALEPRPTTWKRWGVGEPYADQEGQAAVLGDGRSVANLHEPTLLGLTAVLWAVASLFAVLMLRTLFSFGLSAGSLIAALVYFVGCIVVLWPPTLDVARRIRYRARPEQVYLGAMQSIADTFADEGTTERFGRANLTVAPIRDEKRRPLSWALGVNGGSETDRRLIMDAVSELFGPVERPRFLLRIDRGPVTLASVLTDGPLALLDRLLPASTLLAVPKEIGRRAETAKRFADRWSRTVGPCELIEARGVEAAPLMTEARRGQHPMPQRRQVWS